MFKDFFNRSKKKKYLTVQDSKQNDVPAGIMTKCPKCKKIMYTKELNENLNVCFNCDHHIACLLYTSPSPRDATLSRMPSSA